MAAVASRVLRRDERGRLGDDARGADVGIWIRRGLLSSGFHREPPVLAVEVAGQYEREDVLREKAQWYLAHGVAVVWILLPAERVALVVTAAGETRHGSGERLPAHPGLPGLEPELADLFRQVAQQA